MKPREHARRKAQKLQQGGEAWTKARLKAGRLTRESTSGERAEPEEWW